MKKYRTQQPIRIDMTPFVSVALLLIVFFVWVKLVQRSVVMSGNMVTGCRKGIEPERSKNVLDIFLFNKDELQFQYHPVGSVCGMGTNIAKSHNLQKLRRILLEHRKEALIPGEMAIVIHPASKSTVGNFVDVLNELRICGNLPYLIDFWTDTLTTTPDPVTASADRR